MRNDNLNSSTLDERLAEERERVEQSMVTVPGYSGPRPFSMAMRSLDDDQRKWAEAMLAMDEGEWTGQDYFDYLTRPKPQSLQLEPGARDSETYTMKGSDGELSFGEALDRLDADDRKRLLDMQLAYGGRLDTQKALDYLAAEKPWNDKIKRTQEKFNARLEAVETEMERVKLENARNDALASQGDWRHIEGGDPLSNVFARGHAILRGDTKDPDYADAAGQVMEELHDRMQDFAESAWYKALPQADKRKYRESQSVLANALSDARRYAARPKDMGLVEEAERSMWRFLVGNVQGLSGMVDFVSDITGGWYDNSIGKGAEALARDEFAQSRKADDFWTLNHFTSTFASGALSMGSMMALGPAGLPMMSVASGGEQYSEAKEDLLKKNPNMSRWEIAARAGSEGILAGATTWATEHLSELFGFGLIPGMPGKSQHILAPVMKKGWKSTLLNMAAAWGSELLEEEVENNLQDFYKQLWRGEGEQFKGGLKGWWSWQRRLTADSLIGTATAMFGGAAESRTSGLHEVFSDAGALGEYGIKDSAMQAYVQNAMGMAVTGDRRGATAMQAAIDEIGSGKVHPGNVIVEHYARMNELTFDQAAAKLKGDAKAAGKVLGKLLDSSRAVGSGELLQYAAENPLGLNDSADIRTEQMGDAWMVTLVHGGKVAGVAVVDDKASALALQDLLRTSWAQADEGVLTDVGEAGGDVRYIGKVDGKWTMFNANGGKIRELSEDETTKMEAQYAAQKGELPKSGELSEGSGHIGLYLGDQWMFNGRPFSVSYVGAGREGRSRWQVRGTAEDLKWAVDHCKSLRVVSNEDGKMVVEGANPREALLMASQRDSIISLDGHNISVQYIGKDADGKAKWAVWAGEDDLKWLGEKGFAMTDEDGLPVLHGDDAIASIRKAIDPDGKMKETDGFYDDEAMRDYLAMRSILPGPDSGKMEIVEYLSSLEPKARASAMRFFAEAGRPVVYVVRQETKDGRVRRVRKVGTRHQCVVDLIESGAYPKEMDGRYFLAQPDGGMPVGQEAFRFAQWMCGEKVEGEREKPSVGSASSIDESQRADSMEEERQQEVAETAGQDEQKQEEAAEKTPETTEGHESTEESKDKITNEDVINGNIASIDDEMVEIERKEHLTDEDRERLEALRVERKTLEDLKENHVDDDGGDGNEGGDETTEETAEDEIEQIEREERSKEDEEKPAESRQQDDASRAMVDGNAETGQEASTERQNAEANGNDNPVPQEETERKRIYKEAAQRTEDLLKRLDSGEYESIDVIYPDAKEENRTVTRSENGEGAVVRLPDGKIEDSTWISPKLILRNGIVHGAEIKPRPAKTEPRRESHTENQEKREEAERPAAQMTLKQSRDKAEGIIDGLASGEYASVKVEFSEAKSDNYTLEGVSGESDLFVVTYVEDNTSRRNTRRPVEVRLAGHLRHGAKVTIQAAEKTKGQQQPTETARENDAEEPRQETAQPHSADAGGWKEELSAATRKPWLTEEQIRNSGADEQDITQALAFINGKSDNRWHQIAYYKVKKKLEGETPKSQPAEQPAKTTEKPQEKSENPPSLEIKNPLHDTDSATDIASALKNDGRTLIMKTEGAEWPIITMRFNPENNLYEKKQYSDGVEQIWGRLGMAEREFVANITVTRKNHPIILGYADEGEGKRLEQQPKAEASKPETDANADMDALIDEGLGELKELGEQWRKSMNHLNSNPGMEQLEILAKMSVPCAKIGYALVVKGARNVGDWIKAMDARLRNLLKGYGMDDEDVDGLLKDAWLADYTVGERTMSIAEWASAFEEEENKDSKKPAETERPTETAHEEKPAPPKAVKVQTDKGENFLIPKDEPLIPGSSQGPRIKANIEAIRLLKKLQAENRQATPEEKLVLMKFTSWGALQPAFRYGEKYYDEIKELLTPEEYSAAQATILDAFYTDKPVIAQMWRVAQKLGFNGGKVGEFGAGVGHFLGMVPPELAGSTRFTAVELDKITAGILSKLYPQARVLNKGLQDTRIADGSLDMVIGNFPFGQTRLQSHYGTKYSPMMVHDYFFIRALDAVRPGGLVISLTSHGTMDKMDPIARMLMGEKANLVGMIRLPQTAFQKNSGTSVVTDIVILQKKQPGDSKPDTSFRDVTDIEIDGETFRHNAYYDSHPDNILGRESTEGSMYRANDYTVVPTEGELEPKIEAALDRIVNENPARMTDEASADEIEYDDDHRDGWLYLTPEGKLMYNIKGVPTQYMIPTTVKGKKAFREPTDEEVSLYKSLVRLNAAYTDVLASMIAGEGDEELNAKRKKMKSAYDSHVAKYGTLNSRKHGFMRGDPRYARVLALEKYKKVQETNEKGRLVEKVVVELGDVFEKRTITAEKPPTSAKDIVEAANLSYRHKGELDIDFMAGLLGMEPQEVEGALLSSDDYYRNPETGEVENSDDYLSGNIVEKLRTAEEAAAKDPAYQRNVKALEAVRPARKRIQDVGLALGQSWIPAAFIRKFLEDKFGIGVDVEYKPSLNAMAVKGSWKTRHYRGVLPVSYQVSDKNFMWVLDKALNKGDIKVTSKVVDAEGHEREVADKEQSRRAMDLVKQLNDEFEKYAKTDELISRRLEDVYNDTVNVFVPRRFREGESEFYPEASHDIHLRDYQRRAVERMLRGNTLLDHCVGAGKTFTMITAAMTLKYQGKASKSMIVMQNSTINSFANDARRLYPSGKILAATEDDLLARNRARFLATIAAGDWDIVIMPQSSFDMLPNNPQETTAFYNAAIGQLEQMQQEQGRRRDSDIQRAIKALRERLAKLLSSEKKDYTMTFDELGIDALFIDEAHEYRKNFFITGRSRIKGLDKNSSAKAANLYLKIENIRRKKGNHNVFFATGTPIVNTLTELWNMERYLRPDVLAAYHVETFDEFADMFCMVDNEMEYDAGGRVKFYDRFSKYQNCELLSQMWRETADVLLSSDPAMAAVKRPKIKGGKPDLKLLEKSPAIAAFMNYAADTLKWFEGLSGKEKMNPQNMAIPMMIYGMARRATVDLRLLDSRLPDVEGGKVGLAVSEIVQTYKETEDKKGAQVVFVDSIAKDKFNVQEEIKRKLAEAGIPAEQIAVMTANVPKGKRQAVFDKVNSGDVRVIIGHTKVLGVGVNIQERLKRAHFLDPTQTPADMEQRMGRIVRFGNIYPEVDVTYYAITNTLDATMYQTLARKARFIEQVRMGGVDEFIEDSDSADYKTVAAMANGDPKILELAQVQKNRQELEMRRSAYYQQQGRLRGDEETSKRNIADLEKWVHDDSEFAKRHAGETFEKVTLLDDRGEERSMEPAEAKEYLKKMWSDLGKEAESLPPGTPVARDVVLNGVKVRFYARKKNDGKTVEYGNTISGDAETELLHYRGTYWTAQADSATTALDGIRNRLSGFDKFAEARTAQIEGYREKLRQTQEELKKPFEGEQELEDAKNREAQLLEEVGAKDDGPAITERPVLSDYLRGIVPGIENIDIDYTKPMEDSAPDLDEDEDSGVQYRESDDGNPDKYFDEDDEDAEQRTIEALQKRFPGVSINYLYEDELPEQIQNLLDHDRNQGKFTYWKGFYYNGKIYVNPLTTTSVDDLVTTIMHEAGVHYGLKQLFSDKREYAAFLDAMQGIKLVASRMNSYINKGMGRAEAVEEVIGEIADKYYGSPMWRRVWTTISDFFKKMLAKIGIDVELEETQIRDIIKAAVRSAEMATDANAQASADAAVNYRSAGDMAEGAKKKLEDVAETARQWGVRMFSWGDSRGGVVPFVNRALRRAYWELAAQTDEYRRCSVSQAKAASSFRREPWRHDVLEAVVRYWNGLVNPADFATEIPHYDDERVRAFVAATMKQREIIDWLSTDVAKIAKLSPALRQAIEAHRGGYHLRSYEAHRNPNYKPTDAARDLAVGRILYELQFQIEATEAVMSASSDQMAEVFRERYAKVQALLDNSIDAMNKMVEKRADILNAKIAEIDAEIADLVERQKNAETSEERHRLATKIRNRTRAKENLARRFNAKTAQYVAQRKEAQRRLEARRDSWRWNNMQPDLYLYLKTRDESLLSGRARPYVNRAHAFAHMIDRMQKHINDGVQVLLDDKGRIGLDADQEVLMGTARGIVERILVKNRGDDRFAVNMDIGPSYRVIQSSFHRRKDIVPEIRQLLGEIEDIGRQFAMTAGRLSRIVVMDRMYRELWEGQKVLDQQDDNRVFFNTAFTKANGKTYAYELEGAKYGMLEGMFTDKATKLMLDGYGEPRGPLMRGYAWVVGLIRYGKTVANPPTHLRNFLGNITFAACDGEMFRHEYIGNMIRACKVLTGDSEEAARERQRLMRLGLIGSGAHSQEIADIAKAVGLKDADFDVMTSIEKGLSLFRKLQGFAEFAYALEDNMFRVAALYNKEGRGIEATEAVHRIRNLYPTYDMAPVFVSEFARYNPFIKDFIIFKAEAIRCYYNAFKYAAQDFAKRDIRASIGLAATMFAATEIGQMLMGALATIFKSPDDKDKEMLSLADITALRKLLPDYRTDNLILPWRAEKDVIKYIDGGYIYPHDYLPMLSAEMTSGQGVGKTAAEIGKRLLIDPVFGGMGLDLFSALHIGRNPSTGRRLSAEPGGRLGYFAKAISPSSWMYLARSARLAVSEEGTFTTASGEEVTAGGELAKAVQPFRVTTLNIPTAYRLKMRRVNNEVAEYQGRANAAWRKYYAGQGLKMDAEAEERKAKAAYEGELGDLLADLNEAGSRFLTREQRDQLLKDAGFSTAKREAILAGRRLVYERPEQEGK